MPNYSVVWVGGWRPALAFHVLYSKSGDQLSEAQLRRLDALRIESATEEDDISEKLRAMKEDLPDDDDDEDQLFELMKLGVPLENGMCNMLVKYDISSVMRVWNRGDGLRKSILMNLADILTPMQFEHFMISAHEMKLGIHEWVQQKDHNNVT